MTRGWRRLRRSPKVARLVELAPFESSAPQELKRLAAASDEVVFEAGETLCREGQQGQELFVIVDGEVEVVRGDDAIAVIGPGRLVGELAVLDGQERSATVRARQRTTAYVLPARLFDPLLDDATTVRRAVIRELARKLRTVPGRRPE